MRVPRALGLDIGQRRIGMALSDPLGITAQGLAVLERASLQEDLKAIAELVKAHSIDTIVVGLPLTMDGKRGPQTQRIESFVSNLRREIPVPVELIDERLTTAEGERVLKSAGASRQERKEAVDQIAAQLILQKYLDKKRA